MHFQGYPVALAALALVSLSGCHDKHEKDDTNTGANVDTNTPADLHGSLEVVSTELGDLPVLRLWGTHQEAGYAYGYLMAESIQSLVQDYLVADVFVGIHELDPDATLAGALAFTESNIVWPAGYEEEIDAMVEGMAAALGSTPSVSLQDETVPIDASMIKLLNASSDLFQMFYQDLADEAGSEHCCSFAAWDSQTGGDLSTVSAGTQQSQWDNSKPCFFLMVRRNDAGPDYVCTNFAGAVTCSRGMNEQGVTVFPQGEYSHVDVASNCYVGLHSRLTLETIGAGADMAQEAATLFNDHPRCGSTVYLVAQGHFSGATADQMAVVLEQNNEKTVARHPSDNLTQDFTDLDTGHASYEGFVIETSDAIVATNHFLSREGEDSRYDSQDRYFNMWTQIKTGPIEALQPGAQEVMRVCDQSYTGFHTFYALPAEKKIGIAWKAEEEPEGEDVSSTQFDPVMFTWDELFSGVPSK